MSNVSAWRQALKQMDWSRAFKITPKRLEAIGVGLVFLAAFWEVTMLRELVEAHNRSPFVELNEKLKLLWIALGTNYGDLHSMHDFVFDQTRNFMDDFNFIEQFNRIKENDIGLSQFSQIRWWTFGFGTLMIMAGKWWEGTPNK